MDKGTNNHIKIIFMEDEESNLQMKNVGIHCVKNEQ
jgi:hypothetical protein